MIRTQPATGEAIQPLLASMLQRHRVFGGAHDPQRMIDGAQCFAVLDNEKLIGAYVLADEWPVLWIRAAAGRAACDLALTLYKVIQKQGRAYAQIGFQTNRRGLIRRAQSHGFAITGHRDGFTQLRKNLC